jgi:hypothetical protein
MVSFSHQEGQAYTELVVSFVIVGLFLFGGYHIWRYGEARQTLQNAARFAAWERTVWEPSDNAVEKHALHRSDESLAKNTLIHQLSLPKAWRRERSGVDKSGKSATLTDAEKTAMLKPALKSFIDSDSNPQNMLSITTGSRRQMGWFVGLDPSFNRLTSLSLDRKVYRTVSVSLEGLEQSGFDTGLFGFVLPTLDSTRSMTLVANPWAGSPPIMRIRAQRQLLVMSTGDSASDTAPNFMAYFGTNANGSNLGGGDFLGMVPWWNFLGGPNGLGGQFVVKKIGLDSGGVNNLLQSGGDYTWDTTKPIASNLLLNAQLQQKEYFDPNGVANGLQRHLNVWDKTTDAKGKPPRNSVSGGKRKWMGTSFQNPIENYYN